ncbi:MAG: hypothetical protein DWQ36_19635 [Acidobacteria bacterium]|nr:MAG: hypothetical protein DWQ30_06005 [Acidobacteriota bacterium]REK03753.1 MAG: hypothetical protein DWQ36_19635 [Acidobacteriota bacterium]
MADQIEIRLALAIREFLDAFDQAEGRAAAALGRMREAAEAVDFDPTGEEARELAAEVEQVGEKLREAGEAGRDAFGSELNAAIDQFDAKLEALEAKVQAVEQGNARLAGSLAEVEAGGREASEGLNQAREAAGGLSDETLELGAKLLIGFEAVKQFQRAGLELTEGLGDLLGGLGLAEEKVESFKAVLATRFDLNPVNELTETFRVWVGTLGEGEALLLQAADAGVPFAASLAKIAGEVRALTEEQTLSNEELERYNRNLAEAERLLDRRAFAQERASSAIFGDVQGIRLYAAALIDAAEKSELNVQQLERLREEAAKTRDELLSLGADVPPKIAELAAAFDAAQEAARAAAEAQKEAEEAAADTEVALEDEAEAAEATATAVSKVGESSRSAAAGQRELRDEAQQTKTVFDELAEAYEKAQQEGQRQARTEESQTEAQGDAVERARALHEEVERLRDQTLVAGDDTERLTQAQRELTDALDEVRASGADVRDVYLAAGEGAADAGEQVTVFGAGTREAAEIVDEFAGAAVAAADATDTFADVGRQNQAAMQAQTISGEELQANLEGLNESTSDLVLAGLLGIDTNRQAAGAQEQLAEAVGLGETALDKQAETAKEVSEQLAEMKKRLEAVEKSTGDGLVKNLQAALKLVQELVPACEELARCMGEVADEI